MVYWKSMDQISLRATYGLWILLATKQICQVTPSSLAVPVANDFELEPKESGEMKPFPKLMLDNGMFYFVLKDLAIELVNHLEVEEGFELSAEQRDTIHYKIDSIYDTMRDHPAIESDRVAFAKRKPDFHLYTPDSALKAAEAEHQQVKAKRGGSHLAEVCSSRQVWRSSQFQFVILKTMKVAYIYPELNLYVVECLGEGDQCNGVTPAYGGSTECMSKEAWVRAYVCPCPGDTSVGCAAWCNDYGMFSWQEVSVPSCCSCAYRSQ